MSEAVDEIRLAIDEWIRNMWYIYTMECYLTVKRIASGFFTVWDTREALRWTYSWHTMYFPFSYPVGFSLLIFCFWFLLSCPEHVIDLIVSFLKLSLTGFNIKVISSSGKWVWEYRTFSIFPKTLCEIENIYA